MLVDRVPAKPHRSCDLVDRLASLGADGPHRLDPWRVAQPQGQSAAGQSPWANARLQHRSELSSLGGDVCGASGSGTASANAVTFVVAVLMTGRSQPAAFKPSLQDP